MTDPIITPLAKYFCRSGYNIITGTEDTTQEVLTNLGALTVNFHCKDYTIHRKSSNLGFDVEGTPTGEGMLDVPRCRKFLHEDMSCVIELWTPWQGDADTAARVEQEWAQRSVQYLKTVL